ncbi:MAG TPA: GYF domain-containing protein [Fimbriimonas sp.]|nr:GYF domain-containing protein [Fimbriimonas sp.]
MVEWYYIGHYGQLGPLTREQIDELVAGGVITRDTYVWHTNMADWQLAERCVDLADIFRVATPFASPPPRPTAAAMTPQPPAAASASYFDYTLQSTNAYPRTVVGLRSDRSRAAAGILQILLPGVGRMYLGYLAYGVLQMALTIITCGILWPWSFIDGIIILTGGVKLDGYGRQLAD